jgi:hypothetical protein
MIELVAAALLQQGPNDVFIKHDKFPQRHEMDPADCDNCACLAPDGDHDCDDTHSVPEPPTLVLLATGLVAIALSRRRPKG